jgi:hypothetical protein
VAAGGRLSSSSQQSTCVLGELDAGEIARHQTVGSGSRRRAAAILSSRRSLPTSSSGSKPSRINSSRAAAVPQPASRTIRAERGVPVWRQALTPSTALTDCIGLGLESLVVPDRSSCAGHFIVARAA